MYTFKFGAAMKNLHRAEKTALKDSLAFQKIVADSDSVSIDIKAQQSFAFQVQR